MPKDRNAASSLLPALVLAGLLALMGLGWWGFPYLQGWIAHNDCVATGRTNC